MILTRAHSPFPSTRRQSLTQIARGSSWVSFLPSFAVAHNKRVSKRVMQTPLAAFKAVKLKYQYAVRTLEDSFHATKNLFEKHNVVFTVGGGLLSAGAAWAGYTARQVHQAKLEQKLQKIEEHMTNVYSLEEQQIKALTTAAARTGVSYKTFFATSSTALIVGYALGFRSGRRFVIRRIPPELLLAAKKQKNGAKTGLSRLLPGRLGTAKSDSGADQSTLGAIASVSSAVPVVASRVLEVDTPSTLTKAVKVSSSTGQPVVNGAGTAAERPDEIKSREERVGESTANGQGRVSDDAASRSQSRASNGAGPQLSSAAVDAALGKTDIERQVDRALEPERREAAKSSEATDKLLQATIPNLSEGRDVDRERVERALEDNAGAASDSVESLADGVQGTAEVAATNGTEVASSGDESREKANSGKEQDRHSSEDDQRGIDDNVSAPAASLKRPGDRIRLDTSSYDSHNTDGGALVTGR